MLLVGCLVSDLDLAIGSKTVVLTDDSLVVRYSNLANWDFMETLPEVMVIDLKKTNVYPSDIYEIPSLGKLQVLEFTYCENLQDLSPFLRATSIKKLTVGGHSYSSLNGIQQLTNLCSLKVTESGLADLTEIEDHINLVDIYSTHNSFTEFCDISKLPNLQSVSLLYDKKLTHFSMTGSASIERVWLHGCEMVSVSLSEMPKLDSLKVTSNIRDLSLRNLPGIPSLELNSISTLQNLTMENLVTLETLKLKDLTSLHTIRSCFGVNELKNLEVINSPIDNLSSLLGCNIETLKITGFLSKDDINAINSLDRVSYISFVSISDPEVFKKFKVMPSLEELSLQKCSLNDLEFLEKAKSLRVLDLSGLQSDVNLSGLRSCSNLKMLILDNSQITSLQTLLNANTPTTFSISLKGCNIPSSEINSLVSQGVIVLK